MTHRWEHEDEYLALKSAFRAAEQAGDTARCGQLRPRIQELDAVIWQSLTADFAELVPYQSVVDALRHTALRLGVAFPDLTDPRNRTGDGQFSFLLSDGMRTVQMWPMTTYSIELFDYADTPQGRCYQGQTTSLEHATRVLSLWFVERAAIAEVHAHCPWMPCEPFRLTGSRLTFE
jgi:hypothetical protein